MRDSLHAPLCGPEMFTPVPAAAAAAAQASTAGAGMQPQHTQGTAGMMHGAGAAAQSREGPGMNSDSWTQSPALQAAVAAYQQLQLDWDLQHGRTPELQQPWQQAEGVQGQHPATQQVQEQQQREQQQPRQQLKHAPGSPAAKITALKLTPELQQQLLVLQKQRELQQRYQQRAPSQAYALRARTPSPQRSCSPTHLPPRSLTPPCQLQAAAAAGNSNDVGSATHAGAAKQAEGMQRGAMGARGKAGAASHRVQLPAPRQGGQHAPAGAAAGPAAPPGAAAANSCSSSNNKQQRVAAHAMKPVQAPWGSGAGLGKPRPLSGASNNAGLSLRPASRDRSWRDRDRGSSTSGAGSRGAVAEGDAGARAVNKPNADSKAWGETGAAGVSSVAAAARVAVAAAIAADRAYGTCGSSSSARRGAGAAAAVADPCHSSTEAQANAGASAGKTGSIAADAEASAAGSATRAGAARSGGSGGKGAAAGVVVRQTRASKLQLLKHQRLRQSVHSRQQQHAQHHQHRSARKQHNPAASAAGLQDMVHAAPPGSWQSGAAAGAPAAAAVAADSAAEQQVDVAEGNVCEVRLQQKEVQQLRLQLQQPSVSPQQQEEEEHSWQRHGRPVEQQPSPVEHSSSSSSACSDAAHELAHWQQQQPQQRAGLSNSDGSNRSGGSSSSSSCWSAGVCRAKPSHTALGVRTVAAAEASCSGHSSSNRLGSRSLQKHQQQGTVVNGAAAAAVAAALRSDSEPSAVGSTPASGDADTGSSISFTVEQLPKGGAALPQHQQGQHQQQHHQQQRQGHQHQQQQHAGADDFDWPPRTHLRTALFTSPTPDQQRRQQRQRQRSRLNAGSSDSGSRGNSGSSSPACSWLEEEDLEDAAAAAEQQMQLLLNNTGLKGPDSPSWAHAAARRAADQQSGRRANQQQQQHRQQQLHHKETHLLKQQQQQQHKEQAGQQSTADQQCEPGAADAPAVQAAVSAGGVEAAEPWSKVQEEDQMGTLLQAHAANEELSSSCSRRFSLGVALSKAEEDFLQLLEMGLQELPPESMSQQWQQEGQEQQEDKEQQQPQAPSSPHGVLQQPPWKPPGVAPSIPSPPPPITGARASGSASTSAQKQQQQQQGSSPLQRSRSAGRSRSVSPVSGSAAGAAAVAAAAATGARYGTADGIAAAAARGRSLVAASRAGQSGTHAQPLANPSAYAGVQQQQQQPVSYQVQLQAYLDTQQQQPQQQFCQQGHHHHHHQQQQQQQHHHQQQQHQGGVRCRLSLPESCDSSTEGDAEVSWAAAALEAAAGVPGFGQAYDAWGPSLGADVPEAGVAAAVEAGAGVERIADEIAEEFAALLEAGVQQQQQQAGRQQQRLPAWGSQVDVGRSTSSACGSSNRPANSAPPAQAGVGAGRSNDYSYDTYMAGLAAEGEQGSEAWAAAAGAAGADGAATFQRPLQRPVCAARPQGPSLAPPPLGHAAQLLLAANAAAADAFAAARQQRLLSHCWSGWTAAVVVGSSARSAAAALLQRALLRQLLFDWRLTALSARQLKLEVLRGWSTHVQEAQADQLQAEIASLHFYQQTLHKAWRAWVVAWCQAASARVLAAQIAARRKAAVLAALADNAVRQQRKRAAAQRADAFRRARLLLVCVRWWVGWARYSRALGSAGAAVQAGVRSRVLSHALGAWQGYVRLRNWKQQASAAAQGFYWSRLATTVLRGWRQQAAAAAAAAAAAHALAAVRQRRLLAAALGEWQQQAGAGGAEAAARAQQQQLLRGCFQEWWVEAVGNSRSFEMQVQGLVRLVTRAFKAWRQLARDHKQQQQQQEGGSSLAVAVQLHAARNGSSTSISADMQQRVPQVTLESPPQQQQCQELQQSAGRQAHDAAYEQEQQRELLCQVLTGWCGYVSLRKLWQQEAPLLAAAYAEEALMKKAWAAWVVCMQQGQGRQQGLSQQVEQQQQQDVGQQQQEEEEAAACGEHHHQQADAELKADDSCGTLLCAEPSLQEILLDPSAEAGSRRSSRSNSSAQQRQQQQYTYAAADEAPASVAYVAAADGSHGARTAAKAAAASGADSAPQHTAVMLAAADVDAWRSWQQQQQEQQLEALQAAAAQHHHATSLQRCVFDAWCGAAAAGAALMSRQAQLKHAAQLQLVQAVRQQQLARAHVLERLLERPFRCWMQLVLLKSSAAAGFRSYQLMFKGFLGWRDVLQQQQEVQEMQMQQRRQHKQQSVQQMRQQSGRAGSSSGDGGGDGGSNAMHCVQLSMQQEQQHQQPKAPRLHEHWQQQLPEDHSLQQLVQQNRATPQQQPAAAAGLLRQMYGQQQQQDWQVWHQQLCLPQPLPVPDAAAAEPAADDSLQPPQQQQVLLLPPGIQPMLMQPLLDTAAIAAPPVQPAAAWGTAAEGTALGALTAPAATAGAAGGPAAVLAAATDGLDHLSQCQPLQLEESSCSSQHAQWPLELTPSEAAFAEEHHSMTEHSGWLAPVQHAQRVGPDLQLAQQAAADAGVAGVAAPSGIRDELVRGCQQTSHLRQQGFGHVLANHSSQQQDLEQQPLQQQQGAVDAEEDLCSSFGNFSCLQDLQSILDGC